MTDANAETVLDLVGAAKGHFLLESGYHSRLWLDLDSLFVDPARVLPLVKQLAVSLRWYDVEGICGPLLGGAFLAQTLASILETRFFFTERVMPRGTGGDSIGRRTVFQPRYAIGWPGSVWRSSMT
jgi:orotate phosphoribosyltransferase